MSIIVNYPATSEATREPSIRGLLVGPLSILARQKKTWSPALLAGVLWRAVTNIGRHRRILQVLNQPVYAQIARNDPRFAFKYLTHGYLARSFSVAQRAASFVHHYTRLNEKFPRPFLLRILEHDVTLACMEEGGSRLAITFGLSRTHDKEGELSLNLEVDGEMVFILSFTIVPGKVVLSEADDALLITRIQGVKGCYRQIQRATRALHDVAPGALLIAALQGLGEALGIRVLACITATDQSSYCREWDHSFRTAYDDFFTELGIAKNAANIFLSPIPLPEKPLLFVKQGHKLRTREKREFKRAIAEQVSERIGENCRGHFRPLRHIHLAAIPESV